MKTTVRSLQPRTSRISTLTKIFPQESFPLAGAAEAIKALMGPKYDGKYLHKLLKEKLGDRRLRQTLTNVVIPTFDIKRLQPTIFSSNEVKKNPSLDALLSDICTGTSAAPTYLPVHRFETSDSSGQVREFHLIDGGVTANNPIIKWQIWLRLFIAHNIKPDSFVNYFTFQALVAINEVSEEIHQGNPDFFPIRPTDYGRFLVISLGTGSPNDEEKYNAIEAAKWGVVGWLNSHNSSPLVDIFTQASSDLVDFFLSTVFQALNSEKNYLCIQDDTLNERVSSVDIATRENLNDLVKVGETLLKKPVTRVNLETGVCDQAHQNVTNEEALKRIAGILSRERKAREARSPIGKLAAAKIS